MQIGNKNSLHFTENLHISNKPEHNVSTVKQKHRMQGILEYIDYREIEVITLVIESCEKCTIQNKLQTKVKIIIPFWSICSVFNLKFLWINNITIII